MVAKCVVPLVCSVGLVASGGCTSSPVDGTDVEAAVLASAVEYLQASSLDYDTVLVHPRRSTYPFVSADDFLRGRGVEVTETLSRSLRMANPPGTAGSVRGLRPSQLMEPRHAALDLDTSRESWSLLAEDVGGAPAVVWFSGVGFDEVSGTALVYYDLRCAPLECVEGHYLALRLESGGWQVEKSVFAWAS